ncbi:hypothetical protein HMI55_001949 [Coelomomyces lativittatus]|nr:hypothetical protein HMI55_001949 [Coelomomyces lativittatus]
MDRSVVVSPFFQDVAHEQDPEGAAEATEKAAAEGDLNGHKPLTRVIAELLANGYTLSEPIVKKGIELDGKFSVSKTLTSYFFSAQARALELGEKYRVTQTLKDIDTKFGLSSKGTAALAMASGIGETVLNTSAGQKVKETVGMVSTKAKEVATETLQIVDEKHRAHQPVEEVVS